MNGTDGKIVRMDGWWREVGGLKEKWMGVAM